MNEFGIRLKMLREENNLTLAELAEKLNTTKSNLSRYENGKVDPALNVVIEYAQFFGVSLDWMAGVSDINNRCVKANEKITCSSTAKSKVYDDAFNKIIEAKISPEKLNQIIDVLKK